MIDDTINRVKALIQRREEIDAELSAIFGMSPSKRGRPRKESGGNGHSGVGPEATNATPSTAGSSDRT